MHVKHGPHYDIFLPPAEVRPVVSVDGVEDLQQECLKEYKSSNVVLHNIRVACDASSSTLGVWDESRRSRSENQRDVVVDGQHSNNKRTQEGSREDTSVHGVCTARGLRGGQRGPGSTAARERRRC